MTNVIRRGRPSLLTDAIIKAICRHLEAGIAFKTACEAEGVLVTTAEKWLASGAEGKAPYAAFFEASTRARNRGEIFLHRKVIAGGKGSKGAEFVLERRFRRHYGRIDRLEHAGHDGGAVQVVPPIQNALEGLTTDELRKLVASFDD